MRAERWWQESSVIDGLFQEPKAYEFVQATRLLRHAPYGAAQVHWANDFEFNSSLNLNFPNTEIESLEFNDEKVELTNLMVGLTGIQGALPYSYTNKIKLSGRHQRHETQKFLGLFNHKLTAHYVDASLNYHLPIRYEIEQDNHYLDILHALNGKLFEFQTNSEGPMLFGGAILALLELYNINEQDFADVWMAKREIQPPRPANKARK